LYQEVVSGTLPKSLQAYGYHAMSSNYVPSYFLFNLNGTYSFKDGPANGLQLFIQINNVFNKQPPSGVGGEMAPQALECQVDELCGVAPPGVELLGRLCGGHFVGT
jgi:hypothetical protein